MNITTKLAALSAATVICLSKQSIAQDGATPEYYPSEYHSKAKIYQNDRGICILDTNDIILPNYFRGLYTSLFKHAPGICLSEVLIGHLPTLPEPAYKGTLLSNVYFTLSGTALDLESYDTTNSVYTPTPGWVNSMALGRNWIYNFATGDNSDDFGSWYYLPNRGSLYIKNAETTGDNYLYYSFYAWDHNKQTWLYFSAEDEGSLAYNFNTQQWESFAYEINY